MNILADIYQALLLHFSSIVDAHTYRTLFSKNTITSSLKWFFKVVTKWLLIHFWLNHVEEILILVECYHFLSNKLSSLNASTYNKLSSLSVPHWTVIPTFMATVLRKQCYVVQNRTQPSCLKSRLVRISDTRCTTH